MSNKYLRISSFVTRQPTGASGCLATPERGSRGSRTPSLHVIGIKDTVVAPCRSEELLDAFAAPAVHRHELVGAPRAMGGHVLPWDPPFHQRVASLIRVAL